MAGQEVEAAVEAELVCAGAVVTGRRGLCCSGWGSRVPGAATTDPGDRRSGRDRYSGHNGRCKAEELSFVSPSGRNGARQTWPELYADSDTYESDAAGVRIRNGRAGCRGAGRPEERCSSRRYAREHRGNGRVFAKASGRAGGAIDVGGCNVHDATRDGVARGSGVV